MTELATQTYVMEDQVGFLLRVAMQRHTAIFTQLMDGEVTQTQFAALIKLREHGPCSQAEIARMIYLDTNTLKGVVDRLKARKLVSIQVDQEDRRRVVIELTKMGLRITDGATVSAHKITRDTLSPLSTTEQSQLIRLLKKMI